MLTKTTGQVCVCSICGPTTVKTVGYKQDGSRRWRCPVVKKRGSSNSRRIYDQRRNEQRLKERKKDPSKSPSRKAKLIALGIDEHRFEEMLADQDGVCAICKQSCKTRKRLAIDHCHETGQVRGLLCLTCNAGLGQFGDSIALLRSAISYLEWTSPLETKKPTPSL